MDTEKLRELARTMHATNRRTLAKIARAWSRLCPGPGEELDLAAVGFALAIACALVAVVTQ